MPDIVQFQKQLLSNPQARKDFAANPKAYLDQHGIQVPANVQLPATIPLDQLEQNVHDVAAHMKDEHLDTAKLGEASATEFARFVGDIVPIKTQDIVGVVGLREQFRNPGDVATVAVVAVAVVAAVVGVKVSVYGKSPDLAKFARPELGIAGVTAGRVGITLHGPGGIRAEGLSADELATVLGKLR